MRTMKTGLPIVFIIFIIVLTGTPVSVHAQQFLQLRKYTLTSSEQEPLADYYFEEALLPALKRQGISQIGVFKSHRQTNDSLYYLFVLHPIPSLDHLISMENALLSDKLYNEVGAPFLDAPYDKPGFERMESVLLRTFSEMPFLQPSTLEESREERVYELRSYESPTETRYRNKVHMFNEGGEVILFDKLGFNAVFYGEVLSGSRMPNLMYLTTFKNMQVRDSLWEAFFDSEKWKSLEKDPAYQHNVSHADIYLLYPTPYSDY
jgi:hypothetical protein